MTKSYDPIGTTGVLEFFPEGSDTLIHSIVKLQKQYNVEVIIQPMNAPGGLPIKLRGVYRDLWRCVYREWGVGMIEAGTLDTHQEMVDWCHKVIDPELRDFEQRCHDSLNWEGHHAFAPQPVGETEEERQAAVSEVAIDMLAECGYAPNGSDNDPVLMAQTYLELAMKWAPKLMLLDGVDTSTPAKHKRQAYPTVQDCVDELNKGGVFSG